MVNELRQSPGDVKWVNPNGIHITLKFLGDLSRDAVERVSDCIESAVSGKLAFTLKTGEKGAFPSLKRPRVFWVGLQAENKDQLISLQKSVEDALTDAGFPKETRQYKPHLTIGRVRGNRDIETATRDFTEYPFPETEIPVTEVLIMKSELTPKGAVYTVQRAFSLATCG